MTKIDQIKELRDDIDQEVTSLNIQASDLLNTKPDFPVLEIDGRRVAEFTHDGQLRITEAGKSTIHFVDISFKTALELVDFIKENLT